MPMRAGSWCRRASRRRQREGPAPAQLLRCRSRTQGNAADAASENRVLPFRACSWSADGTRRTVILWELSERFRLREHIARLYRVEIRGAERVPSAGPCILVANHESLLDPWILCLATPRRVRFMAKAELWRYPIVRWAMEAYGAFPVERGNGDTGAMSH